VTVPPRFRTGCELNNEARDLQLPLWVDDRRTSQVFRGRHKGTTFNGAIASKADANVAPTHKATSATALSEHRSVHRYRFKPFVYEPHCTTSAEAGLHMSGTRMSPRGTARNSRAAR
jgi:hypothetical protein